MGDIFPIEEYLGHVCARITQSYDFLLSSVVAVRENLRKGKMNAVNAGSFPRGCLGSDHGVGGFKGGNIALWGGGGTR